MGARQSNYAKNCVCTRAFFFHVLQTISEDEVRKDEGVAAADDGMHRP
jgi:hypothetical protein